MSQKEFRFNILLLVILIIISIIPHSSSNCKWSNMTQTYFNSTNMHNLGYSSLSPLSIIKTTADTNNPGALIFKNKITFLKDIHLMLQIDLDSSNIQGLNGFAIVFGNHQNLFSLEAIQHKLGYDGILPKAYVVEFDYFYNALYSDLEVNHISIHSCLKTSMCTADETNTIYKPLPVNYQLSPNSKGKWMIHITYEVISNEFSIRLGDLSAIPIISTKVDLANAFIENGYLGFTASSRNKQNELIIESSYLCTHHISYSYPIITIVPPLIADKAILVELLFKNSAIAQYTDIQIKTNCEGFQNPNWIHRSNTAIKYNYVICTTVKPSFVGHDVINEDNTSSLKLHYFNVKAGTAQTLRFAGYNDKRTTSVIKYDLDTNTHEFLWGSLEDFRFELNDEKLSSEGYLKANFYGIDINGNVVSLETEEEKEAMRSHFGIKAKNSQGHLEVKLAFIEYDMIQIQIKAVESGHYELSSLAFTPSNTFTFNVFAFIPSKTSLCKYIGENSDVNNSNTPTVKEGHLFEVECRLYDDWGRIINPKQAEGRVSLYYGCYIERIDNVNSSLGSNSDAEYLIPPNEKYEDSYTCQFKTKINGVYAFRGFWRKKFVITPINTQAYFKVIPKPPTILSASIYNYHSKQWTQKTISYITYIPNGLNYLTALDLRDIDKVLFSFITYKQLSLSDLSGVLVSTHDFDYTANVSFSFIKIDRIECIGVSIDNIKDYWRLSNYNYQLKLNYLNETLEVNFGSTGLYNKRNLKSCHHSFSLSNTVFIGSFMTNINNNNNENEYEYEVNKEVLLGELILKTFDDYFYNYYLDDDSAISYQLNPLEELNTNSSLSLVEININRDQYTNGIYQIYIKGTKSTRYQFSLFINGRLIKNSSVTIRFVPMPIMHYLKNFDINKYNQTTTVPDHYAFLETQTTDNAPVIYFNAYDEQWNLLSYAPTKENDYLGLIYTIKINDIAHHGNNFVVDYNESIGYYVLIDNEMKRLGKYELSIQGRGLSQVVFEYTKIPGTISPSTSIVKVINDIVQYGTNSYISIEMRDQYNNSIGLYNSSYNKGLSQLSVRLLNSNTQYEYEYSNQEGSNAKYFLKINKIGQYSALVLANGKPILNCAMCYIKVFKEWFDITKSKLYSIGLDNKYMMPIVPVLINKNIERPLFKYVLHKQNGELLTKADKSINIEAFVIGMEINNEKQKDNMRIKLNKSWSGLNSIIWEMPIEIEANDLNGQYSIDIMLDDELAMKYEMIIINDDIDYDESNGCDYDIKNTYVSIDQIELVAGKEKSFMIELRTEDNLRWAHDVDITKLKYTFASSSSSGNGSVDVIITSGIKKGQVIIGLMSIASFSFDEPNIVQFTYKDEAIPIKINIIVHPNDLEHISIDSKHLKSEFDNELIETEIEEELIIEFTPYDEYSNVYSPIFNDEKESMYTEIVMMKLFSVIHSSTNAIVNKAITVNKTDKKMILKLMTNTSGVITISSVLFNRGNRYNNYKVKVNPGSISNASIGYIKLSKSKSKSKIIAGDYIEFIIECRDIRENKIDNISHDNLNAFLIQVIQPISKSNQPEYIVSIDKENSVIVHTIQLKEIGVNIIKAFYNNSPIALYNNSVIIYNSPLNYTSTQLSYNNTPYKPNSSIEIPCSVYPYFSIQLYDTFNNKFSPSELSFDINAYFNTKESNVLCQKVINKQIYLFICKNKIKEYGQLISTDGTILFLFVTFQSLTERVVYSLNYFKSNEDVSAYNSNLNSMEIDIDIEKTVIDNESIESLAGTYFQLAIQLMTSDNKRYNTYYYDYHSIDEHITFSYTKNSDTFESIIYYGNEPGSYIAFVMSTKASSSEIENTKMTIIIDDIELPTAIDLLITQNKASNVYLVNSNGEKITNRLLQNTNADKDYYTLRAFASDEYDNIIAIPVDEFNVFINRLDHHSQEHKAKYSIDINGDKSLSITISTHDVGKYVIDSVYALRSYTFNCTNGAISDITSLINATVSESNAGNTVKVDIIPRDKYGNCYINKNDIDTDSIALYYKPLYYNGNYTLISDSMIEDNDGQSVSIAYKSVLTVKGMNIFHAVLKSNKKQIQCLNCLIEVKASQAHLPSSMLMKFNSVNGYFTEVNNNDIEYHHKSNVLFRLYLRDRYGNDISTVPLNSQYNFVLIETASSQKRQLKFNTKKGASYIDLSPLSADEYSNLPSEQYLFVNLNSDSSNAFESFNRKIILAGMSNDNNDYLDILSTHIINSKLTFEAGDIGYVAFELRTINNLRYTYENPNTEITIEHCDYADNSFKYNKENSIIKGTIYMSISSTKAYSKESNCFITVYINQVQITHLHLQLVIYPSRLYSAQITPQYLQYGYILEDSNSDTPLNFSVQGYDLYNNIAYVSSALLKLTIKNRSSEQTIDYSSYWNIESLQQLYSIDLRTAGYYTISAGMNSDDKDLFSQSYTVYNTHGVISSSNTIIQVLNYTIYAGDQAYFRLIPKDQFDNAIEERLIYDLSVSIIHPNKHEEFVKYMFLPNDEYVYYRGTLYQKGVNQWVIKDNGRVIQCYHCYTIVKPSFIYPSNTLIYAKDSNGRLTSKKQGETIYADINTLLTLDLVFRDRYDNIIESIDLMQIEVISPLMSGHSMIPILFDYKIAANKSRISLFIPSNREYIYKNLVSRKDYQFKVTIRNIKENIGQTLIYKIDFHTNKDDTEYGNGAYEVTQTSISPTYASFPAGEIYSVYFKLRTKDGLYYNNLFNLTDPSLAKCIPPSYDNDFKCHLTQTSLDSDEYMIQLYSTKVTINQDNKHYITLMIKDIAMNSLQEAGRVYLDIQIGVPYSQNTQIVYKSNDKMKPYSPITIAFQLSDQFNNKYTTPKAIHKLVVYNNNIKADQPKIDLHSDKETYVIQFIPNYPPRRIKVRIGYINGIYTSEVLQEEMVFEIVSNEISWVHTKVYGNNLSQIKAGDLLDLSVMLYDNNLICIEHLNEEPTILTIVNGPIEADVNLQRQYAYSMKRVVDNDSICPLAYKLIVDDENSTYKKIGTYAITVKGNGRQIYNNRQTVIPADIDKTKFIVRYNYHLTLDNSHHLYIQSGVPFTLTINSHDKYNNPSNAKIYSLVSIKVYSIEENKEISIREIYKTEDVLGVITFKIAIKQMGMYNIKYYYKDEEIISNANNNNDMSIYILPGKCSSNHPHINSNNLTDYSLGEVVDIEIQCHDEYGNIVTSEGGGEVFKSLITMTLAQYRAISPINSKVIDNNNGRYIIRFTPILRGKYAIHIFLNDDQYGNTIEKTITKRKCNGDTPIECPNKPICVSNKYECLIDSNNNCPIDSPISCLINKTETCTNSQINCDCPSNRIKCGFTDICAVNEEECSFYFKINCALLYPGFNTLSPDGICRLSSREFPSKRICPIGFVLCPDLTCRDSYDKCIKHRDCLPSEIRCPDQSCVSNQQYCPNLISCNNKSHYACPNGKCVASDIDCDNLTKCSEDYPFLCHNNVCSKNYASCAKSIACGHGKTLCQDLICRSSC